MIAAQAVQLTDIPNIGRSIAADLVQAGIRTPQDVRSMDPAAIYEALRTPMGQRHDPCVLDVIMSIIAFVEGGEPQPWWHFTAVRKALLTRQAAGTLACPCLLPGQ